MHISIKNRYGVDCGVMREGRREWYQQVEPDDRQDDQYAGKYQNGCYQGANTEHRLFREKTRSRGKLRDDIITRERYTTSLLPQGKRIWSQLHANAFNTEHTESTEATERRRRRGFTLFLIKKLCVLCALCVLCVEKDHGKIVQILHAFALHFRGKIYSFQAMYCPFRA